MSDINETIQRINELYAIKKMRDLTKEELEEKRFLYEIYLNNVRKNLEAQLGNVCVLDENRNEIPVKKKPLH